jgi:hypothetical protein
LNYYFLSKPDAIGAAKSSSGSPKASIRSRECGVNSAQRRRFESKAWLLNENEKKKIKIREKGTLVSYLPMKEKNLKLGNYLDLKQVN